MATHITMGAVMGGGAPVYAPMPRAAQTIASAGTSTQSSIIAASGDYASVDADTAVFVAIGANPVAASGSGYRVGAGQTKDFGPLSAGDKIAILDIA